MTSELGSAQIPIRATLDKLDKDLDAAHGKVESKLGKIAKSAGKLVGGAVLGGIGLVVGGIAAIGAAAHGAAMEVDDAYDTIRIGTGATGDKLAGLQESFNTVYGNFPGEASTVSAIITSLNSKLDATDDVLEELALPLAEVTRMLGGDASANADAFARTLGDWGVPAEQGADLLDKMFVATQKSGIGFDRLSQLMVQFGAPLRNMGFTVEDSIALLSKWEKEGVNTELVMGSLRIASGKFAKAGKPLRESLLATFETIQNTTDSSAALALGMEVFGARAGPDMTAAIREGRFAIDDLLAMMGDAEGAIESASRATEDWPEKFQRAKNKVILAIRPIGDAVIGTIGGAFDALEPMLDGLGPWIEKNIVPGVEKLASAAGVFFDDIAAGKGPVEGIKDVLWTLLPPGLASDLTGAIEWVQQLVADAKAGDWDAVGGAIWEQVQTAFTKAVKWGDDVLAKLAEELSGALEIKPTYAFTDVGLTKSNVWVDIGQEIVTQIVEGLVGASSELLGWVTNPQTITAMNETGNAIGKAIGGFIAAFFGTPGTYEEAQTGTELENMMARVRDNVAETLRTIGREMGGEIYAGIIEGLTGKTPQASVESAIAKAKATPPSWYTRFWEAYKGWYDSLPDWATGSVTGERLQAPSRLVPQGNARGTDYWHGGPTWVGEEGPEIVDVPRGAAIHSNEESRGIAGGTTINIAAGAITVYSPNPERAGIGVLTELRAQGVPVGV